MTAREILEKEYGKAKNFLTPHVLGRGLIIARGARANPRTIEELRRHYSGAYELSEGTDLDHQPMYGVTVVKLHQDGTTDRMLDASRCFTGPNAKADARRYIRDLKRYGIPAPAAEEKEQKREEGEGTEHGQ